MVSRILFVTWDGPQVSYVEGLFLPIFIGLRKHGYEFAVLQFTWGESEKSEAAARACSAAKIPYRRIDVFRAGPLGAFMTAGTGGRHVDGAVKEWDIDALMPRSLLPALAVLWSRSVKRLPVVFDADGLAADERVEFAGLSPRSPVYLMLRWIEARTVRKATSVLVRTTEAARVLAERSGLKITSPKFHIVTNGRDPASFSLSPQVSRSWPRLCYVGSVGPQYLPGRMFNLAENIRSVFPGTTFQLFTRDREAVDDAISSAGLEDMSWISVRALEVDDVPAALSNCDVGFAIRQVSFSMSAVSPIKIGDYLLAGLPIIGTETVGPVAEVLNAECMFSADRPFNEICAWISSILADRKRWCERCRAVGLKEFSLARSIEQYANALELLHPSPRRLPA